MSTVGISQQPQPELVEVKGVRLKHFETVLLKLLPHVKPTFIPLPEPPNFQPIDWESLPPAARVHGNLPGQLGDLQRATKKEDQVKSLLKCIFALILENPHTSPVIVDFGGGSGHLSIPLALLCQNCTVVVVDLKQKSLDNLHEKARASRNKEAMVETNSQNNALKATAIPNLFTFAGDIESYQDKFDIGVALHVCGEATDVVLRKCAFNQAHLVVSPCCVGKLSSAKKDPYIFRATAQNTHTIDYPQSQLFQQCLECNSSSKSTATVANDWNALAKAADYYEVLDTKERRNASRRTAKGLLELDRQLFLQETYSYQAALTRMEPLSASPKNDILIGHYKGDTGAVNRCLESMVPMEDPVVRWTKQHLLHPGAPPVPVTTANQASQTKKLKIEDTKTQDGVDWTWQEEQEIRNQLNTYLSTGASGEIETFVFPAGMGRRKRKLCHFVADQLGLAHWCIGKKQSEKTVAVRPRYVKPTQMS